jgi:16S rRNA (guanine966-N2)-methyltransferase
MPRIIAGEFRSRRLIGPDDAETSRPYLDRTKESVFNLLRGWCENARVLDLFAGVGTMGLEAVSRGANSVLLVEKDRRVFSILQQNIELLGCGDRAVAMLGDALGSTALLRAPRPIDLAFVDPPFAMMTDASGRSRVLAQISRAAEVMAPRSFLVLRSPLGASDADFSVPGWAGPEAHSYGRSSWVMLYQPAARADAAPTGRAG